MIGWRISDHARPADARNDSAVAVHKRISESDNAIAALATIERARIKHPYALAPAVLRRSAKNLYLRPGLPCGWFSGTHSQCCCEYSVRPADAQA